jgi:hypothetical protein
MAPTEPPFSVTGQKLSPNLTLISCYAIHFMSFYFTSPASSLSSAPSAFCASLSGAFFSLCDLLYAISSLSAISTEIHCVLGTALSRYCSLSPSLPLRCLGAWGLVQRVMGLWMGLVQRGMGFSFIPIFSLIINSRNLNEVSFVGSAIRSQYFSLSLCFHIFVSIFSLFFYISIYLSFSLFGCWKNCRWFRKFEEKNRFFANSRGLHLILDLTCFKISEVW